MLRKYQVFFIALILSTTTASLSHADYPIWNNPIPVQDFYQGDINWSLNVLGCQDDDNMCQLSRFDHTIGKYGCALTSLTMLYHSYGFWWIPDKYHNPDMLGGSFAGGDLDPGTLNNFLGGHGIDGSKSLGFTWNYDIDWWKATTNLYYQSSAILGLYYLVPNYDCSPYKIEQTFANGKTISYKRDAGCWRVDWNSPSISGLSAQDFLNWDIQLTNYNPPIMKIKYIEHAKNGDIPHTHFVVIGGYDTSCGSDNGCYRSYNPGFNYSSLGEKNGDYWWPTALNGERQYGAKDNQGNPRYTFEDMVTLYRFTTGYSTNPIDTSNVHIDIHSPVEVQLVDPDGNIIGYDPESGEELQENSRSLYYEENPINALDGSDSPSEPVKHLTITQPNQGNYVLSVFGTGDGPYMIHMEWTKSDGTTNLTTLLTGTATPSLSQIYRISYSPTGDAALSQTNQAPVANAGANQTGEQSYDITLDGSASSDPDGDPLAYTWTFLSKPNGSVAVLSDEHSANPKFTPDMPGTYTLQLIVSDHFTDSAPSTVTITATPVKSRISVTPNFSISLSAGSSYISFDVNNINRIGVSYGTIDLSLADPDGITAFNGTQAFSIQAGQSNTVNVPLNIPDLKIGNYSLTYTQSDETRTGALTTINIPNSLVVAFAFDKTSYRARETAHFTLNVINAGKFNIDNVTATVSVPDAGYTNSQIVSINQGQTQSKQYEILIPESLTAGQHNVSVTLTLPSGRSVTQNAKIMLQESVLVLDLVSRSQYTAGSTISLTIENQGAVDTSYTAKTITLTDNQGNVIYSGNPTDVIMAGEKKNLTDIELPSQIGGGAALLAVLVQDSKTGKSSYLNRIVNIYGLQASLFTKTDLDVYLKAEAVNATTTLASGSLDIDNATLKIKVNRYQKPSGGEFDLFLPHPGGLPFKWPEGIAIDSTGSIYVVDSANHRIQKFDGNGSFVTMWGSYGSGNGQFNYPEGIAIGPDDSVYVADIYNNRIQKFDSNGNFIRTWGSYGIENGQLNMPYGIAVSTDGSVYVADTWNYRIQKFDSNGNFITRWEPYGSSSTHVYAPYGIAVGPDGAVFVTLGYSIGTWNNGVVQKYDGNGNFIAGWGSSGHSFAQFMSAAFVTIGRDGSIFVSDAGNSRVQKLDKDGNYVTMWGRYGSGTGQFQNTSGIVIAPDGVMIVADPGNNRVQRMAAFSTGFGTIFETNVPVNQTAGSSLDYITDIGTLNATGKLYLEATIINSLGRPIGMSVYPFYIVNNDTVLSLSTDKKIYKPGETITISGLVKNMASTDAANVMLVIKNQQVLVGATQTTLYTNTLNIPAGGSYPFTFTTTAGEEATMALTGTISQNNLQLTEISDQYEVAAPYVAVSMTGPDVVNRNPFDLNLQLTNTGKVPADIQYAVKKGWWAVIDNNSLTIPAGETRLLQYNQQINMTASYSVTISGDVSEYAYKSVVYGEAAQITIGSGSPTFGSGIYSEGKVSIPVTLANTGMTDETITSTFTLTPSGLSQTNTYFLPQGSTVTDILTFDLVKGTYTFKAGSSQPYAAASASFTVVKDPSVAMTTTAGAQGTNGLIPVTINLANSGYNDLNGTIALAVMSNSGKAVWRGEAAVAGVKTQTSRNYVINVNTTGILPGLYSTTVDYYSSSGQDLATNQTQVAVAGPIFQITSVPANPSFTVGNQALLAFGVKNTGTLAGSASLSVTAADLLKQSASNTLQPGEEKYYSFNFTVPEDATPQAYFADYALASVQSQGTAGQAGFNIAGVNVGMTATQDKDAYRDGDTAVITMTITKQAQFADGTYLAIIRYGAYHDMRSFNLGSQPVTLTFNVPLASITGDRLFYGIHFQSGTRISQSSLHINTPPVVTVVSPVANGIYNSMISISAAVSDGGLGVSTVECRTDSGIWKLLPLADASTGKYATTWEPVFADNGNHTVSFRATDKAGNTSAPVSVSFLIQMDTTPPVTTIAVGTPKYETNGQYFVSGSTIFTLLAADNMSGVAKTEYKIGGGSFNTYVGPMNLAAYQDGAHTITYRSTDNAGNIEADIAFTVILDKTPPVTTISATDPLTPGVVNTISPRTLFTLAAVDDFSGVKTISYSIDNGAWQTYTAAFSLSGLSAGQHTIAYKTTDNALNEEVAKTITIRLITIDVAKKIDVTSIVLVGIGRGCEHDHHSEKDDNDKDGEGHKSGICCDDVSHDGGHEKHHCQESRKKIADMLTSAGFIFTVAKDDGDFLLSLRSGKYNTYVLVDYKEEDLGEELREAVHYGDGLLFIKTHPDADPSLGDVFGVTFQGMTTHTDLTVTLTDSPISNKGTIEFFGKDVITSITATTAQSFGYVTDNHDKDICDENKHTEDKCQEDKDCDGKCHVDTYPVIVFNQYGRGRSILYTFDLFSSPDQAKASALFISGLNYVLPLEHHVRALGSAPVRIKLGNSADQVDIQLFETLPVKVAVDGITPQAVQQDNTITWLKSLSPNEKAAFGYYLNLPDLSGDYAAKTELSYSNSGNFRPYGDYSLVLTVQHDSTGLLLNILTDLGNLTPKRSDQKRIAEATVKLLSVVSRTSTLNDAKKNIRLIIGAIEELREVSVDISSLRLRLDELLKIWEKKWYLMALQEEK